MRIWSPGCFLLVLAWGIAGCSRSDSPLPPDDEVVKVRITVKQFPAGVTLKAPCDVTLTKQADIDAVMEWLNEIDWSQKGTDLKVADVPQPDGDIILTTKAGALREYRFYWNGGLINTAADRLLQGADGEKLLRLVRRVCN